MDHSGTLVQLGDLKSLPAVFTLVGVATIGVLLQRGDWSYFYWHDNRKPFRHSFWAG